jgi:hypothetical protein
MWATGALKPATAGYDVLPPGLSSDTLLPLGYRFTLDLVLPARSRHPAGVNAITPASAAVLAGVLIGLGATTPYAADRFFVAREGEGVTPR